MAYRKDDPLFRMEALFSSLSLGDLNILLALQETMSFEKAALCLSLTQGRVRHRFFMSLRWMGEMAQKDRRFEECFKRYYSSVLPLIEQ